MSLDSDLFAPPDTLVMSDFTNLTELDGFPKDLFLSNAMEIAEADLLEDLDCKDDLKLMSDGNDPFGTSLKSSSDDDMDSIKARDSPFTLFMHEDTAGSLQFMDMKSQLDSPTVSDEIDVKSMGLTHTIDNSSTIEDGLPSHPALLAANELNCMSLDELDLTHVNPANTMCKLLSPPLKQAVSLVTSSKTPSSATSSSIASLSSPLTKAVVDTSMYKMEVHSLHSPDMVTSSAQIKSSGSSSSSTTSTFSNSDGGTLLNMVLRVGERCNIPQLTSALPQSVSASCARDDSTICGTFSSPSVVQGQIPHVPSIQRSQSSHALGQFRMSHCIGACIDEVRTQPVCKQEVPLSSASGISLFSPYQSSSTQGLSGRPPSAGAPMRRVYSTGDLQGFNGMQSFYGIKAENAIPEESAGVKIGHYTMEERKMKLHRYRQKRTERNFSKKIKYACRKTLADNRPRVRGRFARSDEMGDSCFKGSDLPLIDEYEEAVITQRPRMVRDQQAYFVANNSCIMSSTPIAQFWNTVGMKVAM